ncbi:hypothetical protein O181_002569 [Austropuccinia psidii MF-1]|uniref:Retrovirus-related Pol polyprotein from transposon TNT 1-94-like beta-barrel domain-containing protein n=1 Tax=Austropuccinia psidii MF-1 TaxID=1389203 RepID=A0A9Q3BCH9_9BASI|nr:hypothetical protein [Austropuccinia psidii MF-1]
MRNEPSSFMAMNTNGWNNNSKQFPWQQGGQGSFVQTSIFVPPMGNTKFKRYPHPSTQYKSGVRQWLSTKHPCVHWAQDCPRKQAGKPAAKDPQIQQPDFKLKKLQHVSHPALAGIEMGGEVAVIQEIPEHNLLVLLDSGATHHVTSNQSIFVSYWPVHLSLLVAMQDRHQVTGIGTIKLSTPAGDIFLSNCLHCENVPGVVISLGKFEKYDGSMKLSNGIFYLYQRCFTVTTKHINDRWFIDTSKMTVACN